MFIQQKEMAYVAYGFQSLEATFTIAATVLFFLPNWQGTPLPIFYFLYNITMRNTPLIFFIDIVRIALLL